MKYRARNLRRIENDVVLQGDIAITTLISVPTYVMIKEYGYHYRELITLGLRAKDGDPVYIDKVKQVEEGNAKLQRLLTQLSEKIRKLENENIRKDKGDRSVLEYT